MPGLRYAERDTIGTEATLNGATAEGLRAFYRRWYRPERATMVMVGDADPAMMEELIRARFGGWQGEGPAPAEPDYGAHRRGRPSRSPTSLIRACRPPPTLIWMRPYEAVPHTMARERLYPRGDARRADHQPPAGGACARRNPPSSAPSVGSVARRAASPTRPALSLTARDGSWRDGAGTRPSRSSATRCARRRARPRSRASSAICAPPPPPRCRARRPSQSQIRAEQLIGAIDNGAVVATAADRARQFRGATRRR